VSSNVLFKNHTPRLAAEAIMATNPDVIVLVEVSLAVALHIDKHRYPYEIVFSRTDDRGLGYDLRVLSRHPLEHYDDAAAGGRFFPLVSVSLHNSQITLAPVHTVAPHKVCDKPYWRAQLAGLGESLSSVKGPLVVCGDFNASLSHHPMASFIKRARLTSVLARHGRALRGTWGPRGVVALLPIDHVLVSQDVSSLNIDVVRVPGSDHRALVADLSVPHTSAE
jgi:endonuclease/exonuclease/phosphatase (EEP) superfamily protein YafD